MAGGESFPPMSYVSLTQAHIEARISDSERLSLDEAGQEGSYQSRIPGIIEQITGLVRSKVASCRQNVLGLTGIPQECLFHAVTLARHALLASLPVPEGYIDPRQEEYRAANTFLDAVATCDVLIQPPDDGANPSAGTGICWQSERKLCF